MRFSASFLFLALVGAAIAQTNLNCTPLSQALVTINNLEDYNKVKDCTTLQGLRIADGVTGATGTALNGTALVFASLTSIVADGGSSGLSIQTFASSVSMPLLTSFAGTQITVTASPNLVSLNIGGTAAINVNVPTVSINTLPKLSTMNVAVARITILTLSGLGDATNLGNATFPNLSTVSSQFSLSSCKFSGVTFSQLASVGSFSVQQNNIAIYNFPNQFAVSVFQFANNMDITSTVLNLRSIAARLSVNDNVGTNFAVSFPNLNIVNGPISINNNLGLTSFSTGTPFQCANFSLQGNTNLKSVNVLFIQTTTGGVIVQKNGDDTTGVATLGFSNIATDLSVAENKFGSIVFTQLAKVRNVAITQNIVSGAIQAQIFFNVSGTVSVLSNSVGTLDLSGLSGVGSSMRIQGNTRPDLVNANAFNLTQLQFVLGGLLIDSNDFMSSINVPKLSYVGAADNRIEFTTENSTSFIVSFNPSLKTFTASTSKWIVTGNFTFSDNTAATSVNVDGLVQVGGLDIQRDDQLSTFSAAGLVCSVVIVFNGCPQLITVSLPALSSVDRSIFFTQGSPFAANPDCSVSVNSSAPATCTAGQPAPCYDCASPTSDQYCSADARNTAYAPLCGARNAGVLCPAAQIVNIVLTGGASTFTLVDGGSGSSSTSNTTTSNTQGNGNGNPSQTTPVSSASTKAMAIAMIVALVSAAL